jgi:hypothetical protein
MSFDCLQSGHLTGRGKVYNGSCGICWVKGLCRIGWELVGNGRAPARQQRVQPTPPLRHFRPEKALVVQPVLPRKWVVLRWRG